MAGCWDTGEGLDVIKRVSACSTGRSTLKLTVIEA